MARAAGGRLLLRIEDIDATRCRPEFEAAIYEDLAWLGIAWEQPVRRQSEHFDDYRAALEKLEAQGLIYPSFESRAEIARLVAERDVARALAARSGRRAALSRRGAADRGRPSAQARIAAGEPYALRLDMATAMDARRARCAGARPARPARRDRHVARRRRTPGATWSLARKETPTSYHLSVVVDDALQGVTHVVRGQDLFWSTSVHRLLQALLGLPAPSTTTTG